MTCIEQRSLIAAIGCSNRSIKQCVYFRRQHIYKRVEIFRHLLGKVEIFQRPAGFKQFLADLAYGSMSTSTFTPSFLANTYTNSIAGAADPPPNHQMFVSRMSTPLMIAINDDASP